MSDPMIRPEVRAFLRRWQEVLIGAGVVLAGLWVLDLGGWFFGAVGLLVIALGVGLGVTGFRRLRFRREVRGAGIVDVLEGQIAYLAPGPGQGGFAALPEISALHIVLSDEGRFWKISQPGVAPLLIPVDALGAERLYDAFASLPGLHAGALVAALESDAADVLIWRRAAAQVASDP